MKSNVLLGAALLVSAYAMQSCNNLSNDTSKNKMDSSNSMHSNNITKDSATMPAMNGMGGTMMDIKLTGDFDHDFASIMIVHHQAAVDMAKVENAKGANAEMKTMADAIIKTQETEIGTFKGILKDYKMPEMKKEGGEMHNEMVETMNKMDAAMKAMKMTGDADKDFAMMMIPHHESAITMAEDQISHGKNLVLKKMAQKIIEDQSREIKQFKSWLAKNN
ncbi:MAG: DUF305 domain-containing protein [Deinococcales bacterium]|nr:DUF305 domain-containing protein [Chitinophagaceae bacterium]